MGEDGHSYAARLVWEGNTGEGTARYAAYERRWRAEVAGKPDLVGSAHAAFRGEAERHDPEDLLLAAASACHMLSYLALCAREGIRVVAYEDSASARLRVDAGSGGRFEEILLAPVVTVGDPAVASRATELHRAAHERCFIANSLAVPVRVESTVRSGDDAGEGARSTSATGSMTDLTIALEHRPGALAEMGEALGRAGVSVEGGAAFAVGGRWVAHFLVKDGHAARAALEAAGIEVVVARDVLQRLDQGVPEQLGAITRRMAEAGVSIDVLYSDHEHRLVLVVDDEARGRAVSEAWTRSQAGVQGDRGSVRGVGQKGGGGT
jgi:organic hydroperoxide reductase OsmC/OhrA